MKLECPMGVLRRLSVITYQQNLFLPCIPHQARDHPRDPWAWHLILLSSDFQRLRKLQMTNVGETKCIYFYFFIENWSYFLLYSWNKTKNKNIVKKSWKSNCAFLSFFCLRSWLSAPSLCASLFLVVISYQITANPELANMEPLLPRDILG